MTARNKHLLCSVCQKEPFVKNSELCDDCGEHVKNGSIWLLGIENGSEANPKRNKKVWEVKKSIIKETIAEPMRSIILAVGFSFITEELCGTMGLE